MVTFQSGKHLKLTFDASKCLGCRACQIACATQLFSSLNLRESGIRVNGLPFNSNASFCKQCREPACMDHCDLNAIYLSGGVVMIDYDSCAGCKVCVKACPYDAMFWHEEKNLPIKCNLCNGNPRCVEVCPTHALEVEEEW